MNRIEEIKARLDAATPGPWRTRRASWEWYDKWYHSEHWGVAAGEETWHDNAGYFHPDDARYARDEIEVVEISYDRDYQTAEGAITRESDADFIAAAPDDIAYLLAEIIRLESLISAPRECPTSPDGKHRIPEGDELFDFCPRCGTPLSAPKESE